MLLYVFMTLKCYIDKRLLYVLSNFMTLLTQDERVNDFLWLYKYLCNLYVILWRMLFLYQLFLDQ